MRIGILAVACMVAGGCATARPYPPPPTLRVLTPAEQIARLQDELREARVNLQQKAAQDRAYEDTLEAAAERWHDAFLTCQKPVTPQHLGKERDLERLDQIDNLIRRAGAGGTIEVRFIRQGESGVETVELVAHPAKRKKGAQP